MVDGIRGHETRGGSGSDRLVLDHLSLADAIARRFAGSGCEPADLRQVAYVGLLKASRRYDPSRGDFAAYAAPTVTGELKRHLRDHSWFVRPPREVQDLRNVLLRLAPRRAQELGREPDVADLARASGATPEEVRAALHAIEYLRPHPLDAVDASGAPDARLERAEQLAGVVRACRRLPRREREVLYLRYFEDRSQAEIARELGISQMHVSRLLRGVLDRLRLAFGVDAAEVVAPLPHAA